MSKNNSDNNPDPPSPDLSTAQKRRIRRKRLQAARTANPLIQHQTINIIDSIRRDISFLQATNSSLVLEIDPLPIKSKVKGYKIEKIIKTVKAVDKLEPDIKEMSSAEKSREEVKAAREAKKLAKQKGKKDADPSKQEAETKIVKDVTATEKTDIKKVSPAKGKDEVDKAVVHTDQPVSKDIKVSGKTEDISKVQDVVNKAVEKSVPETTDKSDSADDKNKDRIKAERAAKKAAKQAKKKGSEGDAPKGDQEMTVKDVVNTLKDIAIVAKEVQDVTAKVQAINLVGKKPEESSKSKTELKAERRAKQEAQRAAKQGSAKPVLAKPTEQAKPKLSPEGAKDKEKSPKPKTLEKAKPKPQVFQRVSWFQHLSVESGKEQNIAINSNLHPAIIKLGVQLATRVVSGSNARCIALLDALKKMISDYTLPARTEYARGFEAHLKESLEYLWSMRQPTASQVNAVKLFRHHLTQLPHNVDEFDAKKKLHEEIDRYIHEQIDTAGEAISIAVRNKISDGDKILTYGCSSLIERILREAWQAGVQFETVVVGNRVHPQGREMLRRLVQRGLPCTYLDITAVSYIMQKISKVIVGAQALLADGSVRGALGTTQIALLARARNVPVLVAAETHKVSARVQVAPADYNELGDPDDLIDQSDASSALRGWRANPNLTPLNLMYDVTPPSLLSAVVTELAILPCTSAPVVLRFKLSEYGI